jgi:hypothetical protein
MKTTVGIDYSLTSPGICILTDKEVRLYGFGSKKMDGTYQKDNFKIFLFDYPVYSCEQERHDKLAGWTLGIIKNYAGESSDVDHVLIEGYSFGSASGRCFDIAENGGLLKHKLWKEGYRYSTIPPTTLKKFATGKGNSDKEAMHDSFMSKHFDMKLLLGTKKASNPVSDLVDAFFLAEKARED